MKDFSSDGIIMSFVSMLISSPAANGRSLRRRLVCPLNYLSPCHLM